MNLTRRALFVSAVAVGVASATDALGATPELPDYIRIDARDAIEFGLHNMEFRIHKMEQDACIEMSFEFLQDIEYSYTINLSDLQTEIQRQHPELEASSTEIDVVNDQVRIWIQVREGAHFTTVPFDPGPFASDERKNLTLKLPSTNMSRDAAIIHRLSRDPT